MTESTEEKVAAIVAALRAKGRPMPRTISEIPDFPCRAWNELQDAWKAERLRLQRFAYKLDRDIFDLFASRGERLMLSVYTTTTYLVPVACVALAFVHSWWWLLGLSHLIFGFKRSKTLYNNVIYRAAFSSEALFCFLYCARQVSLATADYKKSYFWNSDEEPKAVERSSTEMEDFTFKKSTRQMDRDTIKEFEREIASWPRARVVGALQLLEAVLSGDRAVADRLYPELTAEQTTAVTNFLRRRVGMGEALEAQE